MVEIKGEYKVYVHINKINGKLYIGQTKQTLLQRSRADGSGYKHSRHFLNAIYKYGWENFEHLILINDISLDMANIIEEELIKKYNTTNEKYGYNLNSGGLNHIPSDETRKIMSENRSGSNHWNYGKHWSEETKAKMSKSNKGRIITSEWRKHMSNGQKNRAPFSLETREKIRISKLGSKNPNYKKDRPIKKKREIKKVIQYNLEGSFIKIFNSVNEAALQYNVDSSNIVKNCLHSTNSCCGFMWEYYSHDYKEKIKPYKERIHKRELKSKKDVYQYDKNGNYITEYKSAKDACEHTKISKLSIQRCCRKELYTAGGFRWSYKKLENLSSLQDENYYKGEMIKVNQYDLNMHYIKTWNSATEAKRKLGINNGSIGKCCRGELKTAGGYIWKYDLEREYV